jgi:hypothetical protein
MWRLPGVGGEEEEGEASRWLGFMDETEDEKEKMR